MRRSRFAKLWLLWAAVYTVLAVSGPNGLIPVPVWPVVSQHVLQARAWLGQDIVVPPTETSAGMRFPVDPRLDVTPYFENRLVRDPREEQLLSNIAVAVRGADGMLQPAHDRQLTVPGQLPTRQLLCFVGFPPGPAFLLLPFAMFLGGHLATQWLSAILGGLTVAMVDRLVPSWSAALGEDPPAPFRDLVTVLAGAGTLWMWIVPDGGTFFFAQTVGVTALTACFLLTMMQRPLLAGLAFGLAITSRPAMLLALPVVVALVVIGTRGHGVEPRGRSQLGGLLRFCIGPAVLGGLALILNQLRFGSALDFGYRFMLVPPFLRQRLLEHGQMSWSYLATNLRAVILAPPMVIRDAADAWVYPWLASDPQGMGVLFVTPTFVAIAAALRVKGRRSGILLASAWSSLILCCLPGLLYYNTGWVQWGGRFLLDAWPLWLMLTAVGLPRVPRRLAYALVILSVISNLWAALLTTFRVWPGCCS